MFVRSSAAGRRRSVGAALRHAHPAAARQDLFGVAFDAARSGMVLLDDDRRCVAANRAAERLLGVPSGRLVGHRADEVWPARLGEALRRRWPVLLRNGHDENDVEFARDDGGRMTVEVVATARVATRTHLLNLRDVTQRSIDRRLLEHQRELLGRAQSIGRFGTWEWNLETGALEFSDELVRLWGRSAERDIATEAARQFVHPDDREQWLRTVMEARASAAPFVHEFRIVRPGGEVRLVESRGETVTDADGRPVRMLGTTQDITDRRRAEIETRNLSTMLDASDDAITACSHDIVFVSWNRGAEKLYGYTAEEAIGEPLDLILLPEERDLGYEVSRRVLAGERTEPFESRPRTKDGRRVVSWLTLSPVFDATGAVTAVAAIGRDITAHKEAQEALAEAHSRVLRALRLKSEFMANMNHELRTPLNGVLGASTLLADTALTDEQREYVAALRVSGDALMAVIEDILDFSKIEAGKLELDDAPFELRALIEDVCSIVALSNRKPGVELACSLDPELPARVLGDEKRVRQVLTNLLNNAAKFTPSGEVVAWARRDDRGDLRIEVVDTGIGIEAAAQESIFESFAQADGSTTRRYGGTGLGLAIAKQLVTLMDGEIGVESAPGEGSTFWFTLPLRPAPYRPSAPTLAGLAGVRVLVSEDNDTTRAILRAQLDRWGAQTVTVADATAALETLRTATRAGTPFQVALVDLSLPGTRGDELARLIRSDPALGGCRVVLMANANADAELRARAPIDALLVKPIRSARLHDELARALRTAPHVDDRPAPSSRPASPVPPVPARNERGEQMRALLAEDNPINQLVAKRLLERAGFVVDIASDGREALELHATRPYSAIFMDCQMPELDGYDATREIRRREGGARHTPIIAMTASTLPGDNERCIAAGMDYFAGKPIEPDALRAVIAQALGAAGRSPTSAGRPNA